MAYFDLSGIKTANYLNKSSEEIDKLSNGNMNISSFEGYSRSFVDSSIMSINGMSTTEQYIKDQNPVEYESPFTIPIEIIRNINNYRFKYNSPIYSRYAVTGAAKPLDTGDQGTGATGSSVTEFVIGQYAVPSIFNPLYSVQITNGTDNTPLLYDAISENEIYKSKDIHNCTIKELVRLSNSYRSPLGNAKYRFADFMYCKDLGKISNNHLITLRKFPYPVPDNIFEASTSFYAAPGDTGDAEIPGDVGRLVTWFGTEDNKLEDIVKYNYKATWKQLESKLDTKESQENDQNRGIMGMVINSFSPSYNKEGGMAGTHNFWSGLLGSAGIPPTKLDNSSDQKQKELYRSGGGDRNKVYTPLNTIQSTHIYEGKLEFSQDITLKFCYKLRAYENINGKSAMLDLLGNILEVTYRRGKFWGGENRIIGPSPNPQGWKKANAFIDKAFDKIGSIFDGLINGSLDLNTLLSTVANAAGEAVNAAADKAKEVVGDPGGAAKNILSGLAEKGVGTLLRGQLKNALGRPSFYAFDSLLPDGLSGLWHLTVGNPKNPILAIGNLIIDSSDIQHSGPLGIDDFPTELTVTVKLKHAKPRDITDIGKMYNRGIKSLYITNATAQLNNIYGIDTSNLDSAQAALAKEEAIANKQIDDAMKAYKNTMKIYDENSAQQGESVVHTKEGQQFNVPIIQNQDDIDKANAALQSIRDAETKEMSNKTASHTTLDNYLINKENYIVAFTNQERPFAVRSVIDEIA